MSFKTLLATFLSFFMAANAWAVGATKVAIVDVQSVVLGSEAGKKAMTELEKNGEYAKVKAKITDLENELKALDEQAKSQGLTWGEDKKKEHQAKLEPLFKDRQVAISNLTRARESVFMQLLKAMEPGIGAAIDAIKSAEGIDLVLDARSAISKSQSSDITVMVTERLNKLNAQATKEAKTTEPTKADKK